jgi:hypothetical protein
MNNKGFIALISVIIISAVLLVVTSTLSFSGFYGRYNILDSELKERSKSLAEACGDIAILKLAGDINYSHTWPEVININEKSCSIENISSDGTNTTINTQGTTNGGAYITKIQIVLKNLDLSIVSWDEIP